MSVVTHTEMIGGLVRQNQDGKLHTIIVRSTRALLTETYTALLAAGIPAQRD